MSPPRGGDLPFDKQLRGSVTFRTGQRSSGPRKGIVKSFKFVADAGYSVARAQMFRFLSGQEFDAEVDVIEDRKVFMKATKNARQQDFKEVSVSNFWELLKHRWAYISEADILTMSSSELRTYEQFTFEFFVYLAAARRVAEGIRRATADRVRAAAAEIVALQEREGRRLDPIATHHLAVHHARQPEGAPLTVPSDNTMRQVLALDAAAEAVQGGVDEHEEDAVEIEVELFGAWVKIRVKRSSLRAALRLPQHDIFSRGVFHGFQPEMMMPQGSDIPDSDHNAPMKME